MTSAAPVLTRRFTNALQIMKQEVPRAGGIPSMGKTLLNGRSVSARRTHRRFAKLERLTPIDQTLVLKSGTDRGEDFSYGSHIFVTVFGFRNSR